LIVPYINYLLAFVFGFFEIILEQTVDSPFGNIFFLCLEDRHNLISTLAVDFINKLLIEIQLILLYA